MGRLEATEILLSQLKIDNGELRIDAEFSKKKYILENSDILKFKVKKIGEFCFVTDGQHGYHKIDETSNIHLLTAKNTKNWFSNLDGAEPLAKWVDDNNKRSSLKENDIILSTRGTVGCCAIVKQEVLPANIDQDVARIELQSKDYLPEYVITFLNSKYGQDWMIRNQTGMVQQGLSLQKVREMPIPILPESFQNKIAEMVKSAHKKLEQSKFLYKQAEEILEKELGIDFESLAKKKSVEFSIVNSQSSIFSSGRLDAEYYQEKYDNLFSFLEKSKTRKLGEIVKITKSIEPGSNCYLDSGIPFYRVSNLSEQELSTPEIFLDEKTFSDVVRPKKNTILFSKDGSIGTAYKIRKDLDGITSGALLHLTVTDKEILPDYLTLVLNSKIVKMQADHDAGGSIIQHWKPSEIKEVVIPILADSVQSAIAEKITESFRLREESKRLLEDAKLAVEQEIEG